MHEGTFTTKAPFRTKHAVYAWADLFEVEVEEGARASLTIRAGDEQALTIDVEDADDLIDLLRHALDSRESAPR